MPVAQRTCLENERGSQASALMNALPKSEFDLHGNETLNEVNRLDTPLCDQLLAQALVAAKSKA